ncbi:hypothetical protein BD626DRAFT_631317 [Schizophyllum amplum]|uniref:Uncharacterized protein n=1 Tax=Schizophyllum amplum TaxID=97359 RepID=A0A550CBH1_9AGAR|nr:hypothetical protein BD626DRAFT_631317 [Auriculariopsis ampla]
MVSAPMDPRPSPMSLKSVPVLAPPQRVTPRIAKDQDGRRGPASDLFCSASFVSVSLGSGALHHQLAKRWTCNSFSEDQNSLADVHKDSQALTRHSPPPSADRITGHFYTTGETENMAPYPIATPSPDAIEPEEILCGSEAPYGCALLLILFMLIFYALALWDRYLKLKTQENDKLHLKASMIQTYGSTTSPSHSRPRTPSPGGKAGQEGNGTPGSKAASPVPSPIITVTPA